MEGVPAVNLHFKPGPAFIRKNRFVPTEYLPTE